jgi:hypothetical protein
MEAGTTRSLEPGIFIPFGEYYGIERGTYWWENDAPVITMRCVDMSFR